MQEKSFERNTRLEGEIRSVMSELLRFEVNDPRLTDVTVSLIRLSPDRSKARVYFSVIGDEEREREAGDGFSAAAPFLRRQLGQTLGIDISRVSVKASTANQVGSLGRGEGMAAYAVALIEGGKDEDI